MSPETRHSQPAEDVLEEHDDLKDDREGYPRRSGTDTASAGARIDADAAATSPATLDSEPIDIPRLRRRIHAYARAYESPAVTTRQLDELLDTDLALSLLRLPVERLHDFLVLDAYKPRMHIMYDRYMDGVMADFALTVRRAPLPADPAALPREHPELWARFEASATAISRTMPYGPYEVQALRTKFGLKMPKTLLDRCHQAGLASVAWQQRQHAGQGEGDRVAMASGLLTSASLVETPLMQSFQALVVAAQVENLRRVRGPVAPSTALFLDRTERLANSLVRLALTVSRINALRHGCKVALFAGRRSSDLLYLVLQNLYCAAHLDGYSGTSSVYVAAVMRRERARLGVPEGEQRGDVGRLLGTHAHEQVSAVQQLLAPYDVDAGRRCGLLHAVAVTPLLAHLLFLAANGGGGVDGGGATALADTFTTAAFLAVARAAAVPAAFRTDVEVAYGWQIPLHATCFDLFRIWRLDSGRYEAVAEAVVAAWEERCAELREAGLQELPRPQLMHSNLESVEHIAQVCQLDPRVRPQTLAFGTLADGFLPFLEPESAAEQGQGQGGEKAGNDQLQEGKMGAAREEKLVQDPKETASLQITTTAALPTAPSSASASASASSRPTIGLASLVMKLVQARPPRPLPLPQPRDVMPSTAAHGRIPAFKQVRLPPCAVKLGDDGSSGKVQVDPRLPPEEARAALTEAWEMARGTAASPLNAAAVSAVLAEAYDAVTRGGVLRASAPL